MIRPTFLLSYLLFTSSILIADDQEDFVFIKKQVHLQIAQNGSYLSISENHFQEKLFLKNFEKYAKETIYYSDLDKVNSIEASSRILVKNEKYKTVRVSEMETGDIVMPGIFYGGYKRMYFVYPKLEKNAIGRLAFTKTIKDPHFIKPFYFQESQPVKHSSYKVTFPKSVKVRFQLYGDNLDNVQLLEKDDGRSISYEWIYTSVPSYKKEDNSPSRSYVAPHIMILIDSYEYNKITYPVSSSVEDLYSWYSSLVDRMESCDSDLLLDEVDKIIKKPMSRKDSAKTVFKWVQKNIKYVAFEDGMAGFIPRSACDVIQKRYGDCKDMANLLKSLYQTIGIDAHLTWIGTRDKPYSYKTLPTTMTDNHMICSVKMDEELLFLDATNQFSDFGMPTSMIQGKEALIGLDRNGFDIKEVPVIDAARSTRSDVVHCTYDGNSLIGQFKSTLTGYMKEDFQYDMLKAEVRKEEEFLMESMAIGQNSILISNEVMNGLTNESDTGQIFFEFRMPEYGRTIGDRIYINLNLHKQKIGERINLMKRLTPLEEDFKYTKSEQVIFDLPEGYQIKYLPESNIKEWSHGSIEISYRHDGNQIIFQKKYVSNYLMIDPDQFERWNEFLDNLSEMAQESIILQKI